MARKTKAAHPNVVEIHGKPYYLGMHWYSYEITPQLGEIQERADLIDAQSYVLRVGESALQVGFCDASFDDLPSGTLSLAALLADGAPQPWLGSFEIAPGRWWYIAVRDNNAVLPNGDILGTEEEITQAQGEHAAYIDWNYHGGTLDDLGKMVATIEAKGSRQRLKSVRTTPTQRRRQFIAAGATAIALAAGAAGYWYYDDQQAQEVMQLQRDRQARLKQGKVDAAKAAFVSPFYTTPAPAKVLDACRQVFAATPISNNGWVADRITCTASAATIEWTRGEGASVRHMPAGVVTDDGEKGTQIVPFSLQADPESADGLVKLADAKMALLAWAQEGGFTFKATPLPPPQIPDGVDPKDLPPVLPALSFVIGSTVSPLDMAEDFSSYPGLRLTTLKESPTGWITEGVLYGKR